MHSISLVQTSANVAGFEITGNTRREPPSHRLHCREIKQYECIAYMIQTGLWKCVTSNSKARIFFWRFMPVLFNKGKGFCRRWWNLKTAFSGRKRIKCFPSTIYAGLKSVFENWLRSHDRLVWTVGLTVEIKLRFQVIQCGWGLLKAWLNLNMF